MNSISKAPSSNEDAEESGWTTYFEDFFNGERSSLSSGVVASSSLLSDAATATNKLANVHEFSESKNGKRFSFKKKKKDFATIVDDALEDTASSPLNSPKVFHENRSDKPKMDCTHLSEEKRSISGEREERKEMGFMEGESDCTELKKRGLCLVPLSVVVNYFG
ncbi:hypothetical protein QN277_002675 [Acacia crassicarpa]|uniref:Uncharacterized protein n=1 Tax=Acacia crassicarpa TaxID=499986 RepID=A0AAE1NBE9_9FABA|nr:hypothetical protein QN277_002675 [Acacia crassicarpa]